MILEHGLDDLTAKWNPEKNAYDIGQKNIYRWVTNDNEVKSEWFTDITKALEWIKEYDRKNASEIS